MDEKEIKRLLHVRSGQGGRRGWRCPDENQLAAYAAQRLNGLARNSVEAHIADCDFCLGQVAFLAQSPDWENPVDVPASLLSGARSLLGRKPSHANWGWRWAFTTAAVACFAILFVVFALQLRRQQSVSVGPLVAQHDPQPITSPPVTVASPSLRSEPSQPVQTPKMKPSQTPVVRSKPTGDLVPALIFPRDGAFVRRSDLEFRWVPVADAVFYEVWITTAEGDLAVERKTEVSSLKLDSSVPLSPGTKYFISVRAHLRDGQTAKSSILSFRLSDR